MTLAVIILALVTFQRLAELIIARRNTTRLLDRGAQEAAAGHYPLLVGFHAVWLAGLWYWAWDRPVEWEWLIAFLIVQVGRVWVLATLGERWTTRILVVPGERLVASGPYRFVRHPNYVVVTLEIALLPMVFGLYWYGLGFLLASLPLLWWRIRAEERALGASSRPQSAEKPDYS